MKFIVIYSNFSRARKKSFLQSDNNGSGSLYSVSSVQGTQVGSQVILDCFINYSLSRTIFILLGLATGDWRKENKINRQRVFLIEPVVESLLQVGHYKQ